jgi:hypothetical protein
LPLAGTSHTTPECGEFVAYSPRLDTLGQRLLDLACNIPFVLGRRE